MTVLSCRVPGCAADEAITPVPLVSMSACHVSRLGAGLVSRRLINSRILWHGYIQTQSPSDAVYKHSAVAITPWLLPLLQLSLFWNCACTFLFRIITLTCLCRCMYAISWLVLSAQRRFQTNVFRL